MAWITELFEVEEVGLEVLDRPEQNLIAKGGHILLALNGDTVVGTCALLRAAPDVYQMVKMAVDRSARGKDIGRALGEAVIEKARAVGARKVMLYSNRAGSVAAIALYRTLGFREAPLPTQAYVRADIYMELDLQ